MAIPPRHIAIIDDNRMKRQFLADLLKDAFSVHTYGSGEEALREIPHLDLQCILLDIDMPGEYGFQVIRRIKDMPVSFSPKRRQYAYRAGEERFIALNDPETNDTQNSQEP